MGTSFYAATLEATPIELVEKYGLPAVTMGPVETGYELEVDMHSGNADRLLGILGYTQTDEGWVGSDTPDVFLGRVLMGLALEPQDEGSDMHLLQADEMSPAVRTLVGDGGARVWGGQRSPGRTQELLRQLQELAEFCKAEGYLVAWA